ncbi:hypothetical protein GQ53DRAFT_158091 [Thozetella sp. PMI_491]|nr:hypothetical protein GQ53DRAFT_158091 [Thozetella sp. PMI_491]
MNNEQFRKLLLANSAKSGSDKNAAAAPARPADNGSGALGSRLKPSIPMTPRAVAGRPDFARQLFEREQGDKQKQKNKFKSSAPKGSKLAQGYVDRASARNEEGEDERAAKLKDLEESLKNEEIDRETYDRLRCEIAGGDLESTHLVKGLDFKLLKRVRQGEDVYRETTTAKGDEQEKEHEGGVEVDTEDELDRLEATEVHAMEKERPRKKKGQLAAASLNPGQKRSRNQILAELKAAREAAKAKEESSLGSRFKRIGAKKAPGTRIERDSKGREVMIIIDEDGHERRKVRKVDTQTEMEEARAREAFVPDKNAEVLGMEVPEFYKKQQLEKELKEEEQEFKMFDDADSDYDPLADLEGKSDVGQSSASEAGEVRDKESRDQDAKLMPPPKLEASSVAKNYFTGSKTGLASDETYKAPSMDDPSFLAGLRKARALDAQEKSEEEQKTSEREARLRKLLQSSNRDDEDLDMGFGTNRMEDEADFEDTKVKLSAWGEDDEHEGGGGGEKAKRKRGGKKRKGDKDSFADVMSVMQRNKDKS